jgi:hypothetical protein
MSGFNLFKSGECLICSGISKGCRQSTVTDLLFCRETSANPTGYIFRGEDAHGFAMWQASEDAEAFLSQGNEERSARRREYLETQKRRQQQQIALQMPAVERDKHYRRLLNQLVLAESDRTKLLERGFTLQQITRDGYKSVSQWQKVSKVFPLNLPGFLPHGALNVSGDGILCPIRDKNGLIVGCQVRLHDGTHGRYRWLTSCTKKNPDGATSHLDGELPIGVFEPAEFTGNSVWLTEGTSIKPSITCDRLGVPVIGAASGRFDTSPQAAKLSVEYLCTKYNTNVLSFAIDAGDVVNANGVPERWHQQFNFFQKLGYICRIAWWGQVTKDCDDVDELVDTSAIAYITPDKFWKIVEEQRNHKLAPTDPLPEQSAGETASVPEERSRDDWAWENWKRSRTFTPDRVIHQKHFEFGEIPDDNVIVCGKSGLGTNKTGEILKNIKETKERLGRGAKLEGYRNNLLLQTIQRAAEIGVTIYHLRQDDGVDLLADTSIHQAFCSDSNHLVDGYYDGSDLYNDECISVVQHIINGGTLGERQANAIEVFTRAMQKGSRSFLLDGNLSDMYVDFIAKLAPEKTVIKIENKQKIPPHTIKIVDGIDFDDEVKKRDRSALLESLCGEDVTPFVYCDSLDRTKVIDKILRDRGRKGFVLNSETAGEDWAKELLADPNEFIKKYKPDYLIFSPTAESGVNIIVNNYFTDKFTFFSGVANTDSQHQGMFRLRDNTIPHYVFCPEKSNVRDRNNPNVYSTKKFLEILNDRILSSGFLASQTADNPQRALEVIGAALARQNNPWWEFAAQLGALDNFEMDNLRKCLVYVLEEAGHNVEIVKWKVNESLKEEEKVAKDFLDHQKADELHAAIPYNSIEEAQKVAKGSPRKETQRRIELTYLLSRLPEITESETWNSDFIYECHIKRKDYISQQERFWLVQNADVSAKRHEASWYYASTKETFFSARMKGMGHDRIWALKELDILQFVGKEYHKNSPEVISFNEKLRQNTDIQKALKIHLKPATIEGNERIEIIGNLLQLVGFKNKSSGKKNVGDIRLVHHTCEPNVGNPSKGFDLTNAREAILKSVETKFTIWMQSDKSQISWVVEEPPNQQPPVPVPTQTEPSLVDILVQELQKVTNWAEVTQEMVDIAWWLVDGRERDRLKKLYLEYIKPAPSESSNYTLDETDEEVIAANTELLRIAITDKSWGMIVDLTKDWFFEFKLKVWQSLVQDERDFINELKIKWEAISSIGAKHIL